jgi:hypothetical protein
MADMIGGAGVVLGCTRAEGHKGAWHHDPRGYWWQPEPPQPISRCATPGHAHQWSEPWASHVPARADAGPAAGHRARRQRPGSAGNTSKHAPP